VKFIASAIALVRRTKYRVNCMDSTTNSESRLIILLTDTPVLEFPPDHAPLEIGLVEHERTSTNAKGECKMAATIEYVPYRHKEI